MSVKSGGIHAMTQTRHRKCKAVINGAKCGERFIPEEPWQEWCSESCRSAYNLARFEKLQAQKERQRQKAINKKKKQERQQHNKRKKQLRESSVSHQKSLTQDAVNKLVKLRDKDQACISCGTTNPDIQYAAGHCLSRGAFPELRYNFKNIHKQCNKRCNKELAGNIYGDKHTKGYRQGLLERYGDHHLQWIDGPHHRIKYTCEDLIAFRKEVNEIIREMERGEPFRLPSMYQDN